MTKKIVPKVKPTVNVAIERELHGRMVIKVNRLGMKIRVYLERLIEKDLIDK